MNKEQIKALRQKLGLTQKELAQKIGVDQVSVNRWENGASEPSPMAQKLLSELEKSKPNIIIGVMTGKQILKAQEQEIKNNVIIAKDEFVGYSKDKQLRKSRPSAH